MGSIPHARDDFDARIRALREEHQRIIEQALEDLEAGVDPEEVLRRYLPREA